MAKINITGLQRLYVEYDKNNEIRVPLSVSQFAFCLITKVPKTKREGKAQYLKMSSNKPHHKLLIGNRNGKKKTIAKSIEISAKI